MSKTALSVFAIGLMLIGTTLIAHPHFDKNIVVKLPAGQQLTIAYSTTPANEMLAERAAVGQFVTPQAPKLTLSAALKAGAVTVPAGQYTIGAIKNSATDWTMALFPGMAASGAMGAADVAKIIKLESLFVANASIADHMLIDITPGHGKFEGRAVLTLHFGKLLLSGALS